MLEYDHHSFIGCHGACYGILDRARLKYARTKVPHLSLLARDIGPLKNTLSWRDFQSSRQNYRIKLEACLKGGVRDFGRNMEIGAGMVFRNKP